MPAGDGVARIRREVGGRGGKTVTVVTGLALDPIALAALSKRLKAACGTGAGATVSPARPDAPATTICMTPPNGFAPACSRDSTTL